MPDLKSMTPEELTAWCKEQGMPAFRGKVGSGEAGDIDEITVVAAVIGMAAQLVRCGAEIVHAVAVGQGRTKIFHGIVVYTQMHHEYSFHRTVGGKDLPVFFIAGKDDPVGSYGKGIEKSVAEFKKAGMTDVSMKLYPLCRHEILNEINKEEVYEDIAAWIEKVI